MTTTRSRSVTDAVRRALEIDDLGQQRRVRLTLTTPLARAPARLWPLLSTPEGLATWFGPVQGDLSEGGRFRAPAAAGSLLAATGTDPVEGSVLAVEAPHRLVMSWERGEHVDPVTILLDPEDDGTTSLVLTHTLVRERAELEESGPGVWALPWGLALPSWPPPRGTRPSRGGPCGGPRRASPPGSTSSRSDGRSPRCSRPSPRRPARGRARPPRGRPARPCR